MTEARLHTAPQRRRFIKQVGVLGAGTALGVYAPAVLSQSRAPLKIGVLNSFSKVFAALAGNSMNGMNMYFDQIGNKIAGRKIELVREDDETNPQVGLTKMKKLVESDKVDLVTGLQASNVALAVLDYVRQSKTLTLCSGAGVSSLSYTNAPTFFRCSLNGWQVLQPFAEWAIQNISKECMTFTSDFAGGREGVDDWRRGFVRMRGGKIGKEIYAPLGTNDFSPYLAEIRSANPPFVFTFFAGTDAVRFVKQWAEYGLKDRVKLLAVGFMVESDVLPAQGRDALGVISALHYSEALDTPENRKFVADYRARYKEYPSVYSEYGYVAARILHEAVQAVDGNTQDKDKLRGAMLALRMNAPRGPFRFNPATQSPIQNIYIREVAEINGRLTNKVIATVKDVREPDVRPT